MLRALWALKAGLAGRAAAPVLRGFRHFGHERVPAGGAVAGGGARRGCMRRRAGDDFVAGRESRRLDRGVDAVREEDLGGDAPDGAGRAVRRIDGAPVVPLVYE